MTFAAVAYAGGPYAGPTGAAAAGGATMPEVSVDIAFTSDPGEVPDWVDVSEDYMAIETNRGRNQELDRYQAGTCSVTLKDTARKYDPTNAAGPYFPNLRPMKRLRVLATWAGVTYPVFSGYIDSIDPEYAGPPNGMATATIRATDGFKVLAAAELPSSAYALEVADQTPVAWWRLGEANDTTLANDAVGDADLTRTGTTVTFGQTGLVSRDGDTAVSIVGTAGGDREGLLRYGATPVPVAPLTVEMLFRWVGPSTAAGVLFVQFTGGGGRGYQLQTTAAGVAQFGVVTSAGNVAVVGTTVITDGAVHHLAAVWEADGMVRLYVDGVSEGTPTPFAPEALPSPSYTVIGGTNVPGALADPADGIYDEVALYSAALTAAQVANHAAQVATPWNGDTPAARLTRLADYLEWPADLREFDMGTSTLQSASLATNVLEHAQLVAASDFGALFMRADGVLRFIGREGLFTGDNLAIFGDDPTDATERGYRVVRPEYTDALIRNDVSVSRVEGVAQRVEDATSIREYLRHSFPIVGLIHDSDTLSRSAAEFLVEEFKEPRRRISELQVAPRGVPNQPGSTADDLFPVVLGAELTTGLTVIDRPPGGGAANEQDSAIEGIAHRISPMWWETSWRLAPALGSAGVGAVWVWDVTNWDEHRWGF